MTIFLSTRPSYNDPEPWIPAGYYMNVEQEEANRSATGESFNGDSYRPRPEYEIPRSFEQNSYLLNFRVAESLGLRVPQRLAWLDHVLSTIDGTTTDEAEHARKVLARLRVLYTQQLA